MKNRMQEGIVELFPNSAPDLGRLPFPEGFFPVWQTEFWNRFLLRSKWADAGFLIFVGSPENPDAAGFFELRSLSLGQFGLFCVG